MLSKITCSLLAEIKGSDPREKRKMLLPNSFQSAQYRDVSIHAPNDLNFVVLYVIGL